LGHSQTFRGPKRMSALPPKADIRVARRDVCYGPKAEVGCSFNQLVGATGQCDRKGEAEYLGCLEVDH
jgi:hypothetical protein